MNLSFAKKKQILMFMVLQQHRHTEILLYEVSKLTKLILTERSYFCKSNGYFKSTFTEYKKISFLYFNI